MYHAIHVLLCILLGSHLLVHGDAADKPAPGDLLSNIAARVIPSALVKGFEGARPIRTAISETIGASSVPATTTAKPKPRTTLKPKTRSSTGTTRKPRTTETPLTADKLKFRPEQRPEYSGPDSARAAQNQFPFDYRNNFGLNGGGFQSNGRQFNPGSPQGFNPGFFGDRNPFNQGSGAFRPFDSPVDPSGARGSENAIQGSDGRAPGADSGFNDGTNRPFGSPGDFDRFRDFGRFGYDDRFSGRFPGQFSPGFRQDDRSRFEGYPGQQNSQEVNGNYRQDPRFSYPNALNDQRLSQFSGSFPFQGYAPNNFDFQPNQRFQNPFGDNYRGVQGPSNFPLFYPSGQSGGSGGPGTSRPNNSSNGNASGPLTSASKNSEKLQTPSGDKKNSDYILTEAPSTSFQDQKLFYPQLDDYSDLRFRPDGFLINSNLAAKRGVSGKA
ncbi:uncharacterized protein LOC107048245 [Diachasma alloeum]|uniref:uncharacterized protein LOC107048245 n=1 Tax=Diachasma alloeum TaxID=454923 RepID=UPI000738158C|nr:uncharacterized protein LOC107048245 [Diachasma alloeum]